MRESGYIRKRRRTVYENRWLRFEAHDIVHPNGEPGEHGVVIVPAASGVVVIDGDDVILEGQARYAVDRVVLEIVKGGADHGEDPLAAAQRELREELGLAAARWDELGIVYEIPSIMQQPIALFVARDISVVGSAPEAVETIDAVRMPFAAALGMAGRGEIPDAVSTAALFRTAYFLDAERG